MMSISNQQDYTAMYKVVIMTKSPDFSLFCTFATDLIVSKFITPLTSHAANNPAVTIGPKSTVHTIS